MSEIKIGLIPCPNWPTKLAKKLQEQLPSHLQKTVADDVEFNIEVDTDPLVGAAEDTKNLLSETEQMKNQKQWDFALCLTDLPIFDGKELVLADADYERNIGQVSIPAFGSFPFAFRVRKVVSQILKEFIDHSFESSSGKEMAWTREDSMSHHRKKRVTKQFPLSMIRRSHSTSLGKEMDLHLVIRPRLHARLRVLSGMTFANEPWAIIPSFKPVVAVAFATGAYGLIFPTLWTLSGAFQLYRFLGLMVGAILSIIVWIIVSHQLWEKPTENNNKAIRKLYNRTTVTTLIIAVLSYYLALFILFLLTTLLFVPPHLLTSQAGIKDPNFGNYLKLAWLATSIATFAGSIGAGLENQDAVQNIMYGYRQNRRAKNKQPDQDDKTTGQARS